MLATHMRQHTHTHSRGNEMTYEKLLSLYPESPSLHSPLVFPLKSVSECFCFCLTSVFPFSSFTLSVWKDAIETLEDDVFVYTRRTDDAFYSSELCVFAE